jgi:hypothetical protein
MMLPGLLGRNVPKYEEGKRMKRVIAWLSVIAAISCVCACAWAVEVGGVEIHGYVQNRVYDLPSDPVFFQSERVSLSATAKLDNDTTVYVENYWHPAASSSGTYVESAYVDFVTGPGHLRVGKGRNLNFGITPSYSNRKTSNYGLFSEEFTQDRIYGAQYYQNAGDDTSFGLTVALTPRIGSRLMGDPGQNTVAHIADRDLPGDLNRRLAVMGRVSHNFASNLRAGVSGEVSTLSDKDIAGLNTLMGTTFASDRQSRLGVDATYKVGNLVLQGELVSARTSNLDHSAWYILGGWEVPNGMRYYARYAQANYDVTANAAFPATWDKSQLSLSIVKPIQKGVWLQLEHEINGEKDFSVDNNVTFLELFTGF